MDSSSSSVQQKHEVFLSFSGEDTRNNFTSHLLAALKRKSIDTFIDNELIRGEEISSAFLKVIEDSKISIIILSKSYASSSWCLDELSKIVECKNTNGQVIIPIFYHVDPSDVRKQKGSFEQAFAEHEEHFKERTDKVQRWRDAMKEVANLCGWHLQAQQKDRSESELIAEIVEDISEKLIYKSSNYSKGLIGIDSHIQQIESLLSNKLVDVCIIGIWGMGGVGKTTIAEAIFNQIFTKFEGCCFLANVREESERYGHVRLQEELFSKIFKDRTLNLGTSSLPTFIVEKLRRRKVLIVLDDVNDSTQLHLLPRKYCFGPGSRIILTSRDKQVLQQVADEIYEVKGLIDHQALQLFSLNAFKQNHPGEDYMEISNRVVNYAEGIPLALKVLGCALYGKSKLYWESSLNKLQRITNPKIHNLLRISYDGLDDELKGIFLDIACFFKGENRDYVTTILGGCYFAIYSGISDLVDKSLITISHNKLWVHDLLQEMGWNIVRGKSIKKPGKWSRLWNPEDVYHVLKNNTGTAAIEGIILDMSKIKELHLNPSVFVRMYNLRLLKLYYSDFQRDRKVYLSQKALKYLSHKLCYLHWDGYPSKSLPSNFCPENLVELNMPSSNANRLWDGVQNLVKLKQLDLSSSKHLIRIPDLSRANNLESMKLSYCISLVEVPSSIRYLKKLRILSLLGCSNITQFPEISGILEELQLHGTAIEEVPSSIGSLSRLRYLCLANCKRLESLPNSICKLKVLENLSLLGCSKLKSFPVILETMSSLKELSLKGTMLEELPSSIDHLVGLTNLDLDNCKKLKNLPASISKLKTLQVLSLSGCSTITKFPEISGTLVELSLHGTAIKQVPSSIGCLSALNKLNLMNCTELESLPSSIYRLNLESLYLSGCSKLESFAETLDSRERLEELDLKGITIQELPSTSEHLSGLVALDLRNSNKFLRLGNRIGKMTSLKYLFVSGCLELGELLDDLENLDSLEHLCLSDCNLLEFPNCVTCISSLRILELSQNNFGSIPASIKQLSELERLDLSHCKRLQSLPDLPPRLDYLNAHDCTSLAAVSSLFSTILNWSEEFVFTNCLKLDQNALGHIMAQAQLRIQHRATKDVKHYYEPAYGREYWSFFTICFPGSQIPEWFSFQHTGSSITVLLPQHLRDDRFVGFALCVVVALEDFDDGNSGFKVACQCKFKTNNNECRDCFCSLSDRLESRFVGSDHVFLTYDFNLYLEWETKYDFTEASFEFYASDSELFIPVDCYKVKKCGVCLLYAQDDPTESPTRLSSSCVINEDFGESMLEDGTTIKRCRSDLCNEEAGSSGNFSLDEEEPQPKRLQLFQWGQQPTQD